MQIAYYPGCTLKNKALNFEESTILSLRELGIELDELEHWNCCGTVFSFTTDNVIYHLAPIRNLIRTREKDATKLLTLCSMCFNTLRRAHQLFIEDHEKRKKIDGIMDKEEVKYDGKVDVVHLLEVLRDDVGFEKIREKTEQRLKDLKVAAYYGCMLVRPEGVGIDDMEEPRIFEDFVELTGAEAVNFPHKTECCGSYQTVTCPEVVAERTHTIINSARQGGADALVVSCPLCAFNLDHRQKMTKERNISFTPLPILYLSELLCLALGINLKQTWRDLHYIPLENIDKKLSVTAGRGV